MFGQASHFSSGLDISPRVRPVATRPWWPAGSPSWSPTTRGLGTPGCTYVNHFPHPARAARRGTGGKRSRRNVADARRSGCAVGLFTGQGRQRRPAVELAPRYAHRHRPRRRVCRRAAGEHSELLPSIDGSILVGAMRARSMAPSPAYPETGGSDPRHDVPGRRGLAESRQDQCVVETARPSGTSTISRYFQRDPTQPMSEGTVPGPAGPTTHRPAAPAGTGVHRFEPLRPAGAVDRRQSAAGPGLVRTGRRRQFWTNEQPPFPQQVGGQPRARAVSSTATQQRGGSPISSTACPPPRTAGSSERSPTFAGSDDALIEGDRCMARVADMGRLRHPGVGTAQFEDRSPRGLGLPADGRRVRHQGAFEVAGVATDIEQGYVRLLRRRLDSVGRALTNWG